MFCPIFINKQENNMKNNIIISVLVSILIIIFNSCETSKSAPPIAKENNIVDEYYGVKVDDPYRYMENLDDAEVQQWIKGQAEYASKILSKIPGRAKLINRLQELDSGKPFSTYSITRFVDGTRYYMKRMAGENVAKLFVRYTGNNDEQLLIDTEKIKSEDNQHFSINFYSASPDGKYVVYGLAKGGSEQTIIHILDTESGENLSETIDRIEPYYNKPRWMSDESGFFYSRLQKVSPDDPETEIYKKSRAYFHKLGTSVKDDIEVMGYDLSDRVPIGEVDFPSIYIPSNSDYAVAKIQHGDANEISIYTTPIQSLLDNDIPWVKVCDAGDEVTTFSVFNNNIYLQTAKNAPRFKVVQTSLNNPNFKTANVIIEESDMVIDYIASANDALYCGMIDGGFNRIARLGYYGESRVELLDLPNNAAGYIVSATPQLDGVLIYTNSWTKGSLIYNYNPNQGSYIDSGFMPKGKFDDLPGLTSKEVKVKSHDGVMVPLSIIYKSDIQLNGNNPALIIGYGAYGSSNGVYFNPLNIAWIEQGGVYAIAHVRGGGEYGKEWHLAGQKLTKPNTWKDFIACSEYLIGKGYTSKELIAGQGGSAGGILIGRAITERPDLYAAALIGVGVLDAIRFETTTNGVPNIPEFETVKNEDGFKGLLAMSSYHHVKDGVEYPAVLLTHGMNDPRVEPWMSAKMTARLQAATGSNKPILFRVEFGAGHGVGSTRSQYLEQLADQWAFLLWQFDKKI